MIDVKSVADSILKDYTKIDHVDTLYSHCQNVSTDPVTAYKCFVALGRVFLRLFDRSEIIGGCDVSRPIPDQESMGKIREWLLKYLYKYRVVTSRLLCEGNNSFKAAAAESVLILLKIDSKLTGSYDDKFFSDLIKTIIAAPREEFEGSRDALCAKMDQYADLRTLFYVSIRSILAEHRGEPGEVIITFPSNTRPSAHHTLKGVLLNLYELLASLGPPENKPSTGIRARMYTHGGYSAKNEIRSFTQVWLQLLITPLPDDIVKNILLSLHKKILSHVNSPVSFMDFIIASYEKGGVFGVLALSSLHKMIIEYNIEYPNYYTKLYAILDYEVMHLKYRSRFVRLLYSSLKTR